MSALAVLYIAPDTIAPLHVVSVIVLRVCFQPLHPDMQFDSEMSFVEWEKCTVWARPQIATAVVEPYNTVVCVPSMLSPQTLPVWCWSVFLEIVRVAQISSAQCNLSLGWVPLICHRGRSEFGTTNRLCLPMHEKYVAVTLDASCCCGVWEF